MDDDEYDEKRIRYVTCVFCLLFFGKIFRQDEKNIPIIYYMRLVNFCLVNVSM